MSILDLPNEIFLSIYSYLSISDIRTCDSVLKVLDFSDEEYIQLVYDPFRPNANKKCKSFISKKVDMFPNFYKEINKIIKKEESQVLTISIQGSNDYYLPPKNYIEFINCPTCKSIITYKSIPSIRVDNPLPKSYILPNGMYCIELGSMTFSCGSTEVEEKCPFGHSYTRMKEQNEMYMSLGSYYNLPRNRNERITNRLLRN